MRGPITVLWLLDDELPTRRDVRFRHVVGDPSVSAATITGLLAEGPVLAVVRSEEEGRRALAYGADEVVLASEATGESFEKVVERTEARARARFHRDLFLIDLVRKDDTVAIELLAAALSEELLEPLAKASEESEELRAELAGTAGAQRASKVAETVAGVTQVVEKMKELVSTSPSDEMVDLALVTREVTRALARGVEPVAFFEAHIVDAPCLVGMPRWQVAMMVASLVENAVESVVARGGSDRKISVRVIVEESAAVLEVEDNGAGMPEEHRAYSADAFFTSAKGKLGLGLTLVSSRVRRAGGELMIESEQGVGTTVRAFLPLVGGGPSGERPN